MNRVLIVRPEPGAAQSAALARRLGLEPLTAPIFNIRPVAWTPPREADAVLLTSANAARQGGPGLVGFTHLPCYVVGESTGEAARSAGFTDVRTGPADGAALLALMARHGVPAALHLCGREHIPLARPEISVSRRVVYASEPRPDLSAEALDALGAGALVLLHSSGAAAHFAALADAAGLDRRGLALAAISEAASAAAGEGWKTKVVAPEPRDTALLELAAKLCEIADGGTE
jgi:uroporphyrinogen-III synthase